MKAAQVLSAALAARTLSKVGKVDRVEKVGQSLISGRTHLLRSGAAAAAAFVTLSAASAAASAIRDRTQPR